MKHKWILGVGLLLVTTPFVVMTVGRLRGGVALQEQLRLARSEGIPTSAEEYAATIRPAKPEENAASIYRGFVKMPRVRTDAMKLEESLLEAPGPKTLGLAIANLKANQGGIDLIDQAVERPHCWFDRDWAEGAAVLMPELAYMKGAAGLLGLRGTVASFQGQHQAAIGEAEKMAKIADHVGEEGHSISQSVQASMHYQVVLHLATWASLHPDRPEYRRALSDAIRKFPIRNAKREHAADLYQLLSFIDLTATSEGRAKIGLTDPNASVAEWFVPMFVSQANARVDLVKAERRLWTEYTSETPNPATIQAIQGDRSRALFAFATASAVYEALTDEDASTYDPRQLKARLLRYTALLRALEGGTIAPTISTKDLLSPVDGKPLAYRFDGKEIVIEVSGISEPLKIPVRAGKYLRSIQFSE